MPNPQPQQQHPTGSAPTGPSSAPLNAASRRMVWLRRAAGLTVGAMLTVAAGAFLCRALIGWWYPVSSGSMEPAIMTGESVFLQYSKEMPERFEIVAFKDTGGGASIKRAAGLGGETVLINQTGDIRIDGKMLRRGPGRPPLVPIFDSGMQSISKHWRHGSTTFDPWSLGGAGRDRIGAEDPGPGEVWGVDASTIRRGTAASLIRFHDRVTDGQLDDSGQYVHGPNAVHDVAVEFEARVLQPGGSLIVQLSEQGDVFEGRVQIFAGEPTHNLYMSRKSRNPELDTSGRSGGAPDFLAAGLTSATTSDWFPVRFENVDNWLELTAGDESAVVAYRRNTEVTDPISGELISPGERVRIGAEGLVMEIRNVRVLRDFHVVPRGSYGVGQPVTLGPDEIFVLGDASNYSRDSRDSGPIPVERLIGRGRAVVWPLSAARVFGRD